MSAAAFFYAGSLEIQWQLLIVVLFLFFGTLAFFSVLFDETSIEPTEPLITSNVIQDDNETGTYQNESVSIA
jgi:hypothetical protein